MYTLGPLYIHLLGFCVQALPVILQFKQLLLEVNGEDLIASVEKSRFYTGQYFLLSLLIKSLHKHLQIFQF